MRSGEGRLPPEDFPHEGLAVACCRRFFGRGIPAQELLQEARAAICLAQKRFDPSRGCRFSTYAVPVILGALRAYCRRDAFLHAPRPEEEQSAWNSGQTGSAPLGEQKRRQRWRMLAAYQRMQTFPTALEGTALGREDSFEERVLLRDAIRQLGSPYAQVIGLRYFCGLSQREVGQRLGAAQWQVCRLEKTGLEKLREWWMEAGTGDG